MNLPEEFIQIMQKRLGDDFPAFLRSYENAPCKGLRVNTLKLSAEEFARRAPFPLKERVEWAPDAFRITEEKPGADVYHFAGLYYLQEPSAMCAAPLLGVKAGERVLDLCAAPGGKTVQLAADMGGTGVLIANEIDRGRAEILAQNVERMGIANCMVTSAAPGQLSAVFSDYFDKILVDAPCSGEGMFKKEPQALAHWSRQNVAMCAARQRGILDEAVKMLAGGGKMVYSTCTFAEEEDEMQVEALLKRHPGLRLLEMKKLLPHEVCGEGHFAALLQKEDGVRRNPVGKLREVREFERARKAFDSFSDDFFGAAFGEELSVWGAAVNAVPRGMPAIDPRSVGRLSCGVELGRWDGKYFKPSHALAMAFGTRAKRKLSLSREESVRYLRGEPVPADLENGWCAVCVEEFPLGLGKCVNGVVKNHLPKGLRMLR